MNKYTMRNGRTANVESVNLLPSTTAGATAASYGEAKELGDRGVLRATLQVTARVTAMTSLNVTIQTSKDGVTWYTAGTFTQVGDVATASERKIFNIDRWVRVKYVIVGATNSYTFQVSDCEAA